MMKLPAAVDSEEQVLGAMLVGNGLARDLSPQLQPDDFYLLKHRQIFEAIVEIVAKGELVDEVRVMQAVRKHTDPILVRDLAASVTVPEAARHHAEVLRRTTMRRTLLSLSSSLKELAADDDADVIEALGEAQRLVQEATDRRSEEGSTSWASATDTAMEELEYMSTLENPITGVPTGFTQIDHLLCGLHPGQLILIGARPMVGKTSMATQMAVHAARAGTRVAFFSLEMTATELAKRVVCQVAGVSSLKVRKGTLKGDEWRRFAAAQEALQLPITVFDEHASTPLDIASRCRRIPDLGLVVVDYIQLLHWHRRMDKRVFEVSEVSRALKLLARQLHVPILACAQLNREVESRKTNEPKLSDLRESGTLEQDADVVLLLHDPKPGNELRRIQVNIAKNRGGPTEIVPLNWNPDLTLYSDANYWDQVSA